MKNKFSFYFVIWLICFIAFNVVCFVIPNSFTIPKEVDMLIYMKTGYYLGIAGQYYKYGGSFWASYGLIVLSLIGNLVFTYIVFKKYGNEKDKGMHLASLIRINLICLISTSIVAIMVMMIPNLPLWVGTIIAIVSFVYSFIRVFTTYWASERIYESDKKTKEETNFIYNLTAKAKVLNEISNNKYLGISKEVYEAIRFSDPISSDSLADINKIIEKKFDNFSKMVKENDENCIKVGNELKGLLIERNELCRINK